MTIRAGHGAAAPVAAAPESQYKQADLIASPASLFAVSSASVWPNSNNAIFQRFSLTMPATFRYLNLSIGTASGNLQAGVVKLSGAKHVNFDRVMDTGIVASVTTGSLSLDCGATLLGSGDYAMFLWANNALLTARILNNSNLASTHLVCERTFASGVPLNGSLTAWDGSRAITGLTLEADI